MRLRSGGCRGLGVDSRSTLRHRNASEAGLEEWRAYMRAQPTIGVPSLYCLTCMESNLEEIPDDDWPAIRRLWREYLKREFGE